MRKLLILFSFLFLLLFITPSLAFTQFNPNPNYKSTLAGNLIVDYGSNSSYSYPNYMKCFNVSWNETYKGKSGVLLATNTFCLNWTAESSLFSVEPLSVMEYMHSSNATAVSEYLSEKKHVFTLPKNREGIIFIRYYINDTTNIDPHGSRISYTVDGTTYDVDIDLTAGSWISKAVLIPANQSVDRNVTFGLILNYGSLADGTTIAIDRFSFYTLDDEIPVSVLNKALIQEYCNSTGTVYHWSTTSGPLDKWRDDIMGLDLGAIKSTEDGLKCGALVYKNVTIVRRLIGYHANNCYSGSSFDKRFVEQQYAVARDFVFWKVCPSYYENSKQGILFRQIQPYALIVTGTSWGPSNENVNDLEFDVYGAYHMRDIYNQSANKTITIVIDGEGTKWRFNDHLGFKTDWLDVFSPTKCTPKQICMMNSERYVKEDCSVEVLRSCGAWGCNPEGTACAIGLVGSFCVSNSTIETVSYNGTKTYKTCGFDEICFQRTPTTAECLKVEVAEQLNKTVLEQASEPIAQMFNVSLGVGQAVFGLLVSLGVSAGISLRMKEHAGYVFPLIFAVMVIIMGFMGLLPTWMIVLIALVVAMYFAGIVVRMVR